LLEKKPSMGRTRHRSKKFDELATRAGVRQVLDELRKHRPNIIPKSEKKLFSLLNSVRHVERYSAKDVRSGRPGKWKRETLLEIASLLRAILDRGTHGRVSVSSFIGVYLRVLHFPSDVVSCLERGDLSLQEATLLARLTPHRLNTTASRAQSTRQEVMANHTKTNGSQRSLREQVKEMLGETDIVSSEAIAGAIQIQDELLEVDPRDKRHLFYEALKVIFYAFREIEPEDIDDDGLTAITDAADTLRSAIEAIAARSAKRRQKPVKSERPGERSQFYI
jgi:hypothetical protein